MAIVTYFKCRECDREPTFLSGRNHQESVLVVVKCLYCDDHETIFTIKRSMPNGTPRSEK